MTSVGIDVSKGKSTICILKPYGEVVASPYEIEHTKAEISALVSHIRAIDGEIRIVMEATGAYHLPLLSHFKEAGLFVSIINPLAMKKYASTAIRKGKTDKIDSVRIANYGIDNWFKLSDYNVPDETYAQCTWAKKKGYHASESKAKTIYTLACNGIPTLPSNAPSTKMLTLEAVRVLKEVNKTLEIILTQMQELATTLPEYGIVRAMNGVGDVLAPRLIAEIGDVRHFNQATLPVHAGKSPNEAPRFYERPGTK